MRNYKRFSKNLVSSPWIWLGVAMSILLYVITAKIVEDNARQQFLRQANAAQLAIQVRVEDYADVLAGLSALFQANSTVKRDEFRRYVNGLNLMNRYPGIQNLNYSELVLAPNRVDFEAKVRWDTSVNPRGHPEFAIKPPGNRLAYNVLTYIEPLEDNPLSFGLDIMATPQAAKALAYSRDTGKLISSGRIINIKADNIGLAMRLPLYRKNMPLDSVRERRAAYYGSVGAGFDLRKVMQGVLDEGTLQHIRFKLYDSGAETGSTNTSVPGAEHLLFDSQMLLTAPPSSAAEFFTTQAPMEIGGRRWEIRFSATKTSMLSISNILLPALALCAGLLSTVLLFSIFYSLNSSRRRAEEMAVLMTKGLRESEASLADAQQMAHLGSWLLDPSAGTMNWSAETFHIFGLPFSATNPGYDAFIACMYDEDQRAVRHGLLRTLSTGEEFSAAHRIAHRDGTTRWVQIISRPGINAQKGLLRGTIMDINERKRIEHTLHEKNIELEKSNLAKDRFLANMSHELRTPLNAIIGFTGTLLMKLPGPLTADQDKQLNTIRSSARHLLSLINDLLDLTKIESGKFEMKPELITCQNLIAELADTYRPQAEQKGLLFNVVMPDHPIRFETDHRALSQILINLFNNAIKFTDQGEIKIELRERVMGSHSMIDVMVSDTGVGIKPEDQTKLFQAFTQLDSTLTRRFEGTGLGLHLSQKLAGLLQGQIILQSEYGKGSTFTLTLRTDSQNTLS